tara:strand:+ start:1346 stop:1720 length:375 start_codon:yes stop_codon:yes gene_type:complete
MAITITQLSTQFIDIMTSDTDVDDTVRIDITQQPSTIHFIEVINGISSTAIWLKLFDTTEVTLGTTQPQFIMKVAAGATEQLVIPDGMAFASGISYAATNTSGDQAGSSMGALSGQISLKLITS